MKGYNWMPKERNTKFLGNIKSKAAIDDKIFKMWKSELQKELPPFWASMMKL
ncbi:MAG: hypothetical protein KAJ44_03045 [Thermoplasmatales archaeon]|nr:hypothetical protein [Thermoplasmatales archaeon]